MIFVRCCLKIKNMYFNDPEIQRRALAELEKRKALNTEILKSYGLEV